jgi:hypothetical protein
MFARATIREARWYIVENNDKKRTRFNCIANLLSLIPYEKVPHQEMAQPERVYNASYERALLPREIRVPERHPLPQQGGTTLRLSTVPVPATAEDRNVPAQPDLQDELVRLVAERKSALGRCDARSGAADRPTIPSCIDWAAWLGSLRRRQGCEPSGLHVSRTRDARLSCASMP